MEIAWMQKSGLRIKGKHATFAVNPVGDPSANATLLLDDSIHEFGEGDTVIFHGPGDYEVGGVKVTGIKCDKGNAYSLNIDNISVVVGKISALSALQNKMKEHNIIIVACDEKIDASFITSHAENAIVFYGSQAEETAKEFESEKLKTMNKYSVVAGKLSPELETILLN